MRVQMRQGAPGQAASASLFIVIVGVLWLAWPAQSALAPGDLPDLVVTQISIKPQTASVGMPVTLSATIANRGGADAGPFFVLFRIDHTIAGAPRIDKLAAGAQTDVQALWFVTPGRHTLTVEADTGNRVAESNETNNQLSQTIEFSGDLALISVELNPAHPQPGELTTLSATIANTGARDIPDNFAVQFVDGRQIFTTRFIVGLLAGKRQVVEAEWTPQAGEHVLRVVLNPFKTATESSDLNNSLTQIIDVSTRRPNGADLQVSQLSVNPTSLTAGEVATLTATIKNHGSGPSGSFSVRFQVEGATLAERLVDPGLAPSTEQTIQVPWTPATPGEQVIRLLADSEGVVVEPDETDNVLSQVVEVGPALNACGQDAFLQLDEADIEVLQGLTGLTTEGVRDVFLPRMRQIMETEYQGVNIRFTFNKPPRLHSTIHFDTEDRRPILGLAPLGARFGTAQVFLGSFTNSPSLFFAPLDRLEVIIGTVTSHELGHLLGLEHTSPNDPRDIMSANADLAIFSFSAIPSFTPASLQQLERELPLVCAG